MSKGAEGVQGPGKGCFRLERSGKDGMEGQPGEVRRVEFGGWLAFQDRGRLALQEIARSAGQIGPDFPDDGGGAFAADADAVDDE